MCVCGKVRARTRNIFVRAEVVREERNCGIKPEFIYQMMEEHQCDLFYVDADSNGLEKQIGKVKREHRLR